MMSFWMQATVSDEIDIKVLEESINCTNKLE
jgi:hypothetical protein